MTDGLAAGRCTPDNLSLSCILLQGDREMSRILAGELDTPFREKGATNYV